MQCPYKSFEECLFHRFHIENNEDAQRRMLELVETLIKCDGMTDPVDITNELKAISW